MPFHLRFSEPECRRHTSGGCLLATSAQERSVIHHRCCLGKQGIHPPLTGVLRLNDQEDRERTAGALHAFLALLAVYLQIASVCVTAACEHRKVLMVVGSSKDKKLHKEDEGLTCQRDSTVEALASG